MPPKAELRTTKNGLVPDGDGWFVMNARESRWRDGGPLGVSCTFEGRQRFRQVGINLNVLQPGQPMGMYHRKNGQEGFLVTEHVLVGSGDAPAVLPAVGGRGRGVVYRVCDAAARHGASVERETSDTREAYAAAYADLPRSRWIPYSDGWLPED